MICENLKCKLEHNGSFGSGRFCSRKCANSRNWSGEDKLKKSKSAATSKRVKEANAKLRLKNIKYQNKKVIKNCPICGVEFNAFNINKPSNPRTYCSWKCSNDDKDFLFKKKPKGGYRRGSGHGKSGWYKNVWCDSTYELCYLIYCLDHGIEIERNTKIYYYTDKAGTNRKYLPDFVVGTDKQLIEIKGFKDKNFDLKVQACPTIKVLFKEDLVKHFEYVQRQYCTSNYETLYDGFNPRFVYICSQCDIEFKTSRKRKTENPCCSRVCSGKLVVKRKSPISLIG